MWLNYRKKTFFPLWWTSVHEGLQLSCTVAYQLVRISGFSSVFSRIFSKFWQKIAKRINSGMSAVLCTKVTYLKLDFEGEFRNLYLTYYARVVRWFLGQFSVVATCIYLSYLLSKIK